MFVFVVFQDDEDEANQGSGNDAGSLMQRLTKVHGEFMTKSSEYDEIHNSFVEAEQVSKSHNLLKFLLFAVACVTHVTYSFTLDLYPGHAKI